MVSYSEIVAAEENYEFCRQRLAGTTRSADTSLNNSDYQEAYAVLGYFAQNPDAEIVFDDIAVMRTRIHDVMTHLTTIAFAHHENIDTLLDFADFYRSVKRAYYS